MAGTLGRSARDLIEEIGRDGPGFEFFQAIRLLALSQKGQQQDGRGDAVPRPLRFRTPASLAFPASEILDVETAATAPQADGEDDAGKRALHMTIGFLGLTGPSGVLPSVYTELLVERRHAWRDDTAHRFFDMFSHRAASLFYEAWRKHQFHIAYEAGERDGFTRHLLDTVGAGLPSVRERLHKQDTEQQTAQTVRVPESLLVHFAGLLSRKTISAAAMASLLRGCFGIDAVLEQFAGQWIVLPVPEQSRPGVQACVLGESACVGERVWDRQMKLRVRLGPMDAHRFADFLPGAPGALLLSELLKLCVGASFACDAVLVLRKEDIPSPLLHGAGPSPRLGHDAWLCSRPAHADRDDARFTVLA